MIYPPEISKEEESRQIILNVEVRSNSILCLIGMKERSRRTQGEDDGIGEENEYSNLPVLPELDQHRTLELKTQMNILRARELLFQRDRIVFSSPFLQESERQHKLEHIDSALKLIRDEQTELNNWMIEEGNGKGMALRSKARNYGINFYLDSGATEHLVKDKEVLSELELISPPKTIRVANKNRSANILISLQGKLACVPISNQEIAGENLLISTRSNSSRKCESIGTKVKNLKRKLLNPVIIKLNNVLYSRDVAYNLLSAGRLVESGLEIVLNQKGGRVIDPTSGKVIMKLHYKNRTWDVDLSPEMVGSVDLRPGKVGNAFTADEKKNENEEPEGREMVITKFQDLLLEELENNPNVGWDLTPNINVRKDPGLKGHLRLAHVLVNYLTRMKEYCEELKNIKFNDSLKDCFVCQQAKLKRKPCKKIRERADRPFYRVHADTMGPIATKAFKTRHKFILVLVDDYSHYAIVYAMQNKSDVGSCFRDYIQFCKSSLDTELKLRYVRCDLGTEFTGGEMYNFCKKEGIEFEFAEKATAQHNGAAERFNRSIQEKTRAMLIDSGIPKRFWELAIAYANEIYNRTPHAAQDFKSPYEGWYGKKPDISYLRRFGSLMAIKELDRQGKWEPKNLEDKLFFVGITKLGSKGLNPKTGDIITASHVWITENLVFKDVVRRNDSEIRIWDIPEKTEVKGKMEENWLNIKERMEETNETLENYEDDCYTDQGQDEPKDKEGEEKEEKEVTIDYDWDQEEDLHEEGSANLILEKDIDLGDEPQTYSQALKLREKDKWIGAIQAELESMKKNEVWELVERAQGQKPISSRWIFKIKQTGDSEPKYKARLVIRGFQHKRNYDIAETYAPVARLPMVR